MRVGALIITTGLPRVSGVAALTPEVGAITAEQRISMLLYLVDGMPAV